MAYQKPPRLFFDIETQANPENCALMPEPVIEAPANYKDPEKIAAYIAEKTEAAKAAALERAALDPDYGRILSIGYALYPQGEITVHMAGELIDSRQQIDEHGEVTTIEERLTEEQLILHFWWRFGECDGRCVGYNILSFDLPYLLRRSMALGIKVPYIPNLAKFRTDPVTDLMAILYNWGGDRYKGLKQVARLYRIPNDCPEIDGSKVASLQPDELRAYQASDVKLVMALYQRMNGVYFNQ